MYSYDTFFLAPDGKTYALKGTQFWVVSSDPGAGLESGPHKVSDLWKELPNKIDAAYKKSASRLVFFSGSKWVTFLVVDLEKYRFPRRKLNYSRAWSCFLTQQKLLLPYKRATESNSVFNPCKELLKYLQN